MTPRPRILLVPDSLYWATANIAREIAAHNPGYRFETQSEPVVASLLQRFAGYPRRFDAVHFLLPHAASRLAGFFREDAAIVSTLHHIETERCTASLPDSDAVMVGTTQWRDRLLELGLPAEQIVHVRYGVDAELFRPPAAEERRAVRRELGLPADAFVVGFCGKRSPRKGVETFLEGLRRLSSRLPRAACLLMGPGWEGMVRARADEGLPWVHSPFAVEKRRLAAVYRALDVLWVTSSIEGAPLPVLEAMATEVPCVSTRVGIPLDVIVDGENGFLVDFDDAEAFCDRSLRLATEQGMAESMAAAARATVLRTCQWSQTMPGATALYERALERFRERSPRAGSSGESSLAAQELPSDLRRWVAGREDLQYSRFLLGRREYGPADELAMRAVRANPRDWRLWLHAGKAKMELALRALHLNPRDLKLWLYTWRTRLRGAR